MASIQRPPAWNLGFPGCVARAEGKRWRGGFVRLSRRGDGTAREQVEAAAPGKKQRRARRGGGERRTVHLTSGFRLAAAQVKGERAALAGLGRAGASARGGKLAGAVPTGLDNRPSGGLGPARLQAGVQTGPVWTGLAGRVRTLGGFGLLTGFRC